MDPQGLLYVCVCTGALLLLLQSVSLYSILSLSPFLKYLQEVQQRGKEKRIINYNPRGSPANHE